MRIKSQIAVVAVAMCSISLGLAAQDMPAEYQDVLKALGKTGDFKANVLKVNIPRNDLKVTIDGTATPTPFGFGGWLAMSKGDGAQNGQVYKIPVGRDDLKITEMGATINARMGLNTWAAFYGSDSNAEIAGDVAMLDRELTPVLKALRKNGLNVVAIHNHMTGTQPAIYFLHYWGTGPVDKLAAGFKDALGQLGKR